jgi:hypothetical protein
MVSDPANPGHPPQLHGARGPNAGMTPECRGRDLPNNNTCLDSYDEKPEGKKERKSESEKEGIQ